MGYWKAKPLNTRFDDTYNFIKAEMAAVPNFDASLFVMDGHIEAMTKSGSLDRLVGAMSLGSRFDILGRDAETRRRHYVRSVLLGYPTLGDPDQSGKLLSVQEVEAKKQPTERMTAPALKGLLQRMLEQCSVTEGSRSFVGFKTTLEKQNAMWALDRIVEATTRVQMALGTVSRVPAAMTLYRDWFGNSPPATIRQNFGKIEAGVRGGAVLIKDSDPGKKDVFAYVYPDGPNAPPRIYLCDAFSRAGKLTWQNKGAVRVKKDGRDENDNPLGVLLHELSHIFCRTQDHAYGKAACKTLASSSPAQAAANADNHEYYAEEIMRNA